MIAWSCPACSVESTQLGTGSVCSLSTFEFFAETKLYYQPQWGVLPGLLPASSPSLSNLGCHCCSAGLHCVGYQGTKPSDSRSFHCVSFSYFRKLVSDGFCPSTFLQDASHQGNGSVSRGPLMPVARLQTLMALSWLPRGAAVYHSMEAFIHRESYTCKYSP